MVRRGLSPIVLGRKPELLSEAAWLFARYWEIDREGMLGRPTTAGMLALLDLYEVRDRERRIECCRLWRAMAAAEIEVRDRERKEEEEKREQKEKDKKRQEGRGARLPGVGATPDG